MQILDQVSQDSGQRCIVVEHQGETLDFNIAQYAKPDNLLLIVKQINQFWSKMPIAQQTAIWNCYVRAHETLGETVNKELLLSDLRKIVNELSNYHDYDKIMSFIYLESKIKIPSDLKQIYGPDAPEGPLTYLRPEYMELLGLMMILRTLVPIWGQYMVFVKEDDGAILKEMSVCKIISMSNIVNLKPYLRLKNYVEEYVRASDPIPITAILNGLGSEKIPDWLLSLTLVRRIAMAELPDETMRDDPKSLVSNIYNYIKQKMTNLSKNFTNGIVRDKIAASATTDRPGEDSNTSSAEIYKIKETHSGAVIAAHGIYLEGHSFIGDPATIAQQLDPTVPRELVDTFLMLNNNNPKFDITDTQLTFCQYLLSKKLGPRSGPSFSGVALLNGISISQALLWHWGLYDLAAICGATPVNIPLDDFPTVQRHKLTKEQLDKFVSMYPHYQLLKGKKESRTPPHLLSAEEKIKQNLVHNEGINSIEVWADSINNYAWLPQLTKEMFSQTHLLQTEHGMQYGPTIRRDLADMYIAIYNKFRSVETK